MRKVAGGVLFGLAALVAGASALGAQSYYGSDGAESARAAFGGSLVVVDGQVLVGEPANVMRPGIVYVYERDGSGTWTERQQLRGPDAASGDGFGAALAAAGDQVLVSSNAGVHVLTRNADGQWAASGGLARPADLGEDAGFGAALAAAGDVALVGAPGVAGGAGAVYVYRRGAQGWKAAGTLEAPGLEARDAFGLALTFDGRYALVGAPNRDARTGAVFAFQAAAAGFTALGALPVEGVARNDRFGTAVLLAGDMALVGAPFQNGATGTVFRYALEDGQWAASGRLAAFDGGPRDMFGTSVALAGDELWVGAPRENAAYVFAMNASGEVVAARKVTSDAVAGGAQLASTLAAGSDVVAAGALGEDFGAGSVAIFERDGQGGWREAAKVASPPEGFDAVAGAEVSCQEGEAAEWECSEVDLVSFMPVTDLAGELGGRGIRTNDNWGWQDPETGRMYALVGMTDRASFVDITDPVNPVLVGVLPMTEGANGSAWRDIKTYRNHAFIVSDGAGQHGMQVFDLTRLRDFDGDPQVFDADALYTRIASAHNIVINEETGFAYSVGSSSGGETCGGGLHIINIQDPKSPTFAGCFADPQTGRASTGYTHDAQCVVYNGPDADYQGREICFGANETALSIADVTNKDATVAVSRAAYPNPGYTHQGWLTDDHRYFFMNDELDELAGTVERTRTIIWDVTDLDDPQLLAEHLGTQPSSDHNLYITGNLMYQSNYQSGLRVLDVSDPANPVEVAFFDTVPYGDNGAGFGGSWSNYPFFDNGVVIVTSGNEGLFLVRPNVRRTVF